MTKKNNNEHRFAEEHNKLLKKYGITLDVNIELPGYSNVPFLCRIAVWILNRYGAKMKLTVKDITNK